MKNENKRVYIYAFLYICSNVILSFESISSVINIVHKAHVPNSVSDSVTAVN